MKDRVPLYPGRVKLVPVSGQANTYDMERADQPTQVGDPLNKNTLLKDATAALFGLTPDAVPDNVLELLSRFHKGLGNEYVWDKQFVTEIPEVVETITTDDIQIARTYSDAIYYADSFSVTSDGIALDNPSLLNRSGNVLVLRGKYIKADIYSQEKILFVSDNESFYQGAGGILNLVDEIKIYRYTIRKEIEHSYVNSPDPNAYPPAVSDGYTYTPLGQIGAKVQIATGSYTGTGTYGSSNPNSLTFDFEPKLLYIAAVGDANGGILPVAFYSGAFTNYAYISVRGSSINESQQNAYGKIDGNTVSWYHAGSAALQMNVGRVYNYIAIG